MSRAPRTSQNISSQDLSKVRDRQKLSEWVAAQFKQLQEVVEWTSDRISELENSEKRSQSAVRAIKAKLDDRDGTDKEAESVREELNEVYQEKAQLAAENNLLKQQWQEATRKAEYF